MCARGQNRATMHYMSSNALEAADAEPDPLANLSPQHRAALEALTSGGRYRDAAAAAGVSETRVWEWARRYRPFRDALATATRVHDKRLDALEGALDAGATDNASVEDRKVAVSAARALGSGVALGIAAPEAQDSRARVGVAVTVNVALGDVLRSPGSRAAWAPDEAEAEAELVDLDADATIAASQPARSRVSSQRPARAAPEE